jgi:hypothetical protein
LSHSPGLIPKSISVFDPSRFLVAAEEAFGTNVRHYGTCHPSSRSLLSQGFLSGKLVPETVNAYEISSELPPRNLDIHPSNVHNIQLR